MRFQFIHAADLHIDSPLAALGAKDARVAATFAAAGRAAVERLIAETIESGAKFLLIAGDVFDGDWRDVATGLFFARELAKLDRAGVRTFLIKGNHDAENRMSRGAPLPAERACLRRAQGQTQLIEPLRVAVHGRSFPDRAVAADFVASYPPRREGWLNIGLLHTSLDGVIRARALRALHGRRPRPLRIRLLGARPYSRRRRRLGRSLDRFSRQSSRAATRARPAPRARCG